MTIVGLVSLYNVPGTVSTTDAGAGNLGDANHPHDQPEHS